jgi:hypothetical protein
MSPLLGSLNPWPPAGLEKIHQAGLNILEKTGVWVGRHGVMCSTIRDAVTAIENRQTARGEREKAQALWRIALQWGVVFGVGDFIHMLQTPPRRVTA